MPPNKVLEWKWLMESNIVGFDKMGEKIKYSYPSSLQCNCLPPWSPSGEDWTEDRDGGGGWSGLCTGAEDTGLVLFLCHCYYSVAKYCPSVCGPMDYSTPGSSVLHYLQSLLKFTSTGWWCCLAVSSSAAPFFCLHCFPASGSFPMSWFFAILWWPKYRSFRFSTYNEYARLISLRIDWFDLPAVQGTLRSLLQHHN